ncbi:LysR family transcriptional regulator [Xanthomonas sp. 1678]|uniref:LysR family transcriptional regulator n=1 Tax=Xanthomonas sp. 1678 TaxID=3158788 RepID=UPI00286574DF|nr:DNA-binding transcriptional LysR family regulator [Xanthomonas translucens]
MDRLTGIVAFVRAAEQLSFVGAGRVLGISASAVGKSVAALERELGVRLLQRTTRRIALTAEGRLFFERCQRVLEELREAESVLAQTLQAPRGLLRLGLPTIGYRFLLPLLPAFRQRYPEVELELEFDDRLVDVVERGLDAVIRSGTQADSSLMSRRLGPFRFCICAAPDYLRRRGVPQTPAQLAAHDTLRFRFPTTGKLHEWPLSTPAPLPRAVLTCNNMEALRAAAIGGMGIGCMPEFLAREALADGRLQALLDAELNDSGQFFVLWPSSRQLSPKLRAFVDFVAERLFPAA